MREIEGMDLYDSPLASKIHLVPNIIILLRFKMSKFTKYTSVECLKTHLSIYCSKMDGVIKEE